MLRISYSKAEANQALKTAIPAMASGININTSAGDMALNGADAERVMLLVEEVAKARASGK